jgi:hypothetical protein
MANFVPLIFPKAALDLTKKNELIYVKCIIRNKLLVLTPEEWVRQHVLHFLIIHKNYPLSRLAVEKSINYNGLSKRWDIVAYNEAFAPQLLVECKQPDIKISIDTFLQAAAYQKIIQSENILLTNGKETLCYNIKKKEEILNDLQAIGSY